MKYIMFQLKTVDRPTLFVPVIFPDVLMHKEVAESIEHVKVMPEGPFAGWCVWPKAVSAGFLYDGICRGSSESLKLQAHPDDSLIIESFIEMNLDGIGFMERGA